MIYGNGTVLFTLAVVRGGVAAGDERAKRRGDPSPGAEHLDRGGAGAYVDALAHQLVGHRVVVTVSLDVFS
jgi:hypothetical protein